MPLASMTGFARAQGAHGAWRWHWEVRSVNSRGIDVRVRIPEGFEALEQPVRALAQTLFARGGVTVSLSVDSDAGRAALRVNAEALQQVMTVLRQLEGTVKAEPPRLDGILALRGVLETQAPVLSEDELAQRDEAVLASLKHALDALVKARREEGARLENILRDQIQKMSSLVSDAESLSATQPEGLRARLRQAIDQLTGSNVTVSEERLTQELALLLVKADVREELDRLKAHVQQALDLFDAKGAQGRRLDFLAQEFNREANTLCSKSSDIQLTRIGLDLKTLIDQMREQVQNVE